MRIGLAEMDAQIAEAVKDRLCAQMHEFLKDDIYWGGILPYKFNWNFHSGGPTVKKRREPTPDERVAYEQRKATDTAFGLRSIPTFTVPIIPAMLGGVALSSAISGDAGAMGAVAIYLAGMGAGIKWWASGTQRARLQRRVLPEEMRAVFSLLTLTRAERVYCDTLILLARIDSPPDSETMMRETVKQLNDLLRSSRDLEKRRLSLLPILGTNSVVELEAERLRLSHRLLETTDEVARTAVRQSLAMCGARLENARVCEQGLERLRAQEEAVLQTLSSAQSSLARMQLAPSAKPEAAVQEIAETVAQMNQQTYAVEQAVQEVMNLRGQ